MLSVPHNLRRVQEFVTKYETRNRKDYWPNEIAVITVAQDWQAISVEVATYLDVKDGNLNVLEDYESKENTIKEK